jgi:hypothetical protein
MLSGTANSVALPADGALYPLALPRGASTGNTGKTRRLLNNRASLGSVCEESHSKKERLRVSNWIM